MKTNIKFVSGQKWVTIISRNVFKRLFKKGSSLDTKSSNYPKPIPFETKIIDWSLINMMLERKIINLTMSTIPGLLWMKFLLKANFLWTKNSQWRYMDFTKSTKFLKKEKKKIKIITKKDKESITYLRSSKLHICVK